MSAGRADPSKPTGQGHPPRRSWWRAVRPESAWARWVVLLATIIGGLAAAITVAQATSPWWDDREAGPATLTSSDVVRQGSPEADALVRALFAAEDARVDLDLILTATPTQVTGPATNGLKVFYDCAPGSDEPGIDRCSLAELYWRTNPLPAWIRDEAGWHVVGSYTVGLDPGKGQVYGVDEAAFTIGNVAG